MLQVARLTAVAAVVLAASGCDNPGGKPREAPDRETRARTPLVDYDDPAPDRSIGPGREVRAPVRDGNLVLVPIVATSTTSPSGFITLDEGMATGAVSVREAPYGGYQQLAVSNRSDRPLFVMSGEVVIEGHQDRAFQSSFLVDPRGEKTVPVWCVEPGRSHGAGPEFATARAMVHPALRREVHDGDQSTVWAEVNLYNERHALVTHSNTYRHAAASQHSGDLAARRQRLLAALAELPERDRLVGLAMSLEGKVVAVDVFADPSLFRALEGKLLGSYLAQAVDAGDEVRSPRAAEIREALAKASEETMEVRTALAPEQPGAPKVAAPARR